MKKIKNRAFCTLFIVAAVIVGVIIYTGKYIAKGADWVSFASNQTVYKNGVLSVGTVTDRNGVILTGIKDGTRVFAADKTQRISTLHAVGDSASNIGTGALSAFASKLIGFDLVFGAYSFSGTGGTVTLTIDADLNSTAYNALSGKNGTVLAADCSTGEILCMVSAPAFDPADPPKIEPGDETWEGVYLNRALQAVYTPGSIYKLITAGAAIEELENIGSRIFECKGQVEIAGGIISCPKVHGELSFEDALAVSCNCAFAEISLELGADNLSKYVTQYGLTEKTIISGLSSSSGNFDKAEPKSADLAWSGIGQYNNTVCPASMLRFVSAIANGGTAPSLQILKSAGIFSSSSKSRIMSASAAQTLGAMMSYNTHYMYGTENFPGLNLHAKSGTAEVGGGKEPHAWFVGYAKNETKTIAFVVLVENGGSGSAVAGAVANKVLQAAFKPQ